MKNSSIAAAFAAAAIAATGAITAFSAPTAIADDHNTVNTTQLGSQAELTDGNVVQGWTVSGLKVSTDVIPYQPQGTLWEATATDQAIQGGATPIVSNFNARARDGQTYRALFGVATAQGVNPSTLSQGQQTTGKVYFDVTGAAPDSVVYATNSTDLIVWLTPPPAASTGGAAASGTRTYQAPAATSETPSTSGAPTTSTTETPAAPAGAEPTTPVPTTVPAGSQGTPLPEGTAETAPVPAGSQGTPLPEGQPGLTPAGVQEAPAAAPAAVAPAADGSVPAPAAVEPAPAPVEAGSQGTPLPAGAAPVTTPVVAPPAA